MKIENSLRKSKKNAIKEISMLKIINPEDIHVFVEFILEQEGKSGSLRAQQRRGGGAPYRVGGPGPSGSSDLGAKN